MKVVFALKPDIGAENGTTDRQSGFQTFQIHL